MEARRDVDEMSLHLRRVLEYAGSSAFEAERRKAREEFFGHRDPEFSNDEILLDRCAAYYNWFMFDRRDSRSHKTPVRLYVAEHPDLPARIRTNLLACEDSVFSTFKVVEVEADHVILLNLLGEESDYYRVVARPDDLLHQGQMITARLVRWDGAHHFHGQVEEWPQSPRDVFGW
ncbi:MAG: hypothetical protein HUU35_13370, partial [Armatimonadetes bacterium]|nr:hypothetical protein [Armatimonadota bacterium]